MDELPLLLAGREPRGLADFRPPRVVGGGPPRSFAEVMAAFGELDDAPPPADAADEAYEALVAAPQAPRPAAQPASTLAGLVEDPQLETGAAGDDDDPEELDALAAFLADAGEDPRALPVGNFEGALGFDEDAPDFV